MHPFYEISKIPSRLRVETNPESERNILDLKSKWFDSIADVARSGRRYFILVNGTHVYDRLLSIHEESDRNPYRCLYKEVINQARQSLGSRLFYFFPRILPDSFLVQTLEGGLNLGVAGGNSIIYDPKTIKIIAYGESVDEETHAGCVDSNVRDLITALLINLCNVVIDPDRSLPSKPVIWIKEPYEGYYVPPTLYLTVTQLKELARKGIAN